MAGSEESEVMKKKVPVKDFWNRNADHDSYTVVSSGPLPTFDDLPPKDGSVEDTIVEGSETEERRSSAFPGTPRDDVPTKGARTDD